MTVMPLLRFSTLIKTMQKIRMHTHLLLEVDSCRTDQEALIISLLHRRRRARSHCQGTDFHKVPDDSRFNLAALCSPWEGENRLWA